MLQKLLKTARSIEHSENEAEMYCELQITQYLQSTNDRITSKGSFGLEVW
jgi:hypothetical protein